MANTGRLPERGSFLLKPPLISLLTVCLGGELPLLLLSEPALWCGSGCRLLHPGCGLPDPIVSNSPRPQDTTGGALGLPSKGSHAKAWPSPPHLAASGPGTGAAAKPEESST